jgi:amino acid adenylation domain-containing protein
LSASERHQLLVEFNDTAADYPRDQLIHQLFEAQAARQADATALVFEEQHLSYGELNRRANEVAHHLIALGVKPDDRVAICVERSLEMMVGLLGILKAGGAYVPFDPAYPADRLAYMLEDSAPVALLTQTALRDRVPLLQKTGPALPVLLLDGDNDASILDTNPDPITLGLSSRNLAYVIYTSGSTGLPKGVMVEHRNLANLIQWHCVSFDVTDKCRSSSVAGLAFDASIWEMWPVLHAGGALILAPSAFTSSPSALLEWWRHQNVDVSFLPTPLAEFAFSEGITNKYLRTLLIGGDRLRRPPPSTQFALVNNYGPTEATVVATSGKQEAHAPILHIGRPIANTQVYLLDAHLQPVPLGVAGEIHIGGAGVARGYLNRPELTAERFIADPFSSDPEARLYKTGDLARYLPDGNIEYLGRNDFQVKIRGFRIELGEIEAELTGCEGVREALVIAREDAAGDKRLVAYLVAQDGMELSVEELRDNLSAALPDYMVPAAFVMLDAFPLTPNGKIDRKALPAPDQSSVLKRAYEAPQGETEIAIAQVWQDLLGLAQIGRHDHFFELGGHSLMAVQLLSRVRQQFGVEVALANLFEKPVLIDFADLLVSLQIELFSDTDIEDIKSELVSLSENELKPC